MKPEEGDHNDEGHENVLIPCYLSMVGLRSPYGRDRGLGK